MSPLSSRGTPAPLMTRPNRQSPTGIWPPSKMGVTRAPGSRPLTVSTGMRKNLSRSKPTTSASIWPSCCCTQQRSPTFTLQPTASKVRPTIRVSWPLTIGLGLNLLFCLSQFRAFGLLIFWPLGGVWGWVLFWF